MFSSFQHHGQLSPSESGILADKETMENLFYLFPHPPPLFPVLIIRYPPYSLQCSPSFPPLSCSPSLHDVLILAIVFCMYIWSLHNCLSSICIEVP